MLPDRYDIDGFKRALRDPSLFIEELQRLSRHTQRSIHGKYYLWKNRDREFFDFMQGDWDNLFILDACRADLFEETADLDSFDEYRTVLSPGSNTTLWSSWHFAEKSYGDVVYVTANPVVSRTSPNSFHKLIEVWNDSDAYDKETRSIPPEPVSQAARSAYEKFPDKRLVVHYSQPHIPFITRPEMVYRTEWNDAAQVAPEAFETESEEQSDYFNLWQACRHNDISEQEVWAGYKENLEVVLESVLELEQDIPGQTVITSDHGNFVGERLITGRKEYGHKGDYHAHHLNEVPWAVISDNRREIVEGPVQSRSEGPLSRMEERLRDLGYMT
jgi:hypothetical protein